MISIQVAGEFLELFQDTNVSLRLVNPIFADDGVIPGSYSIPFDIPFGPASPKNSRLLNNADVISNPDARKRVSARMFIGDIFWKSGMIKVVGADLGKASLKFEAGLSTVASGFKNARLKDLVSDVRTMTGSHTYTKRVAIAAKWVYPPPPGSTPFVIRVNGIEFSGITNNDLVTAINASTVAPRARAIYHGVATYAGAPDYFTVENYDDPNDINQPLTIDIGDELSYRWVFDADAFEDDYNDPLIAWLNDYITAPTDPALRFGLVKNSKLYREQKQIINTTFKVFQSEVVNVVNADGFILNKPVGGSALVFYTVINPVNYTSVSPYVRIKHILDTIAEEYGLTLAGSFLDDDDYPEMVLYHSNCLEVPIPFVGTLKWLATRNTFNVNEFVPDVTIGDFLKKLQTRYNVGIYLNDKTNTLTLSKRDAIVQSYSYKEITARALRLAPPDLTTITGIRLQAKKDKDDLATDDVYELGEVEQTIATDFSSPPAEGRILYGGSAWVGSDLREFESIYSERDYSTEIPFVIALNKERVSLDDTAIDYPALAINGVVDGKFAGANGIALKRWKSYLRFLFNRKTVPGSILFNVADLLELDWEKKLRIDGVNYLIKDIDVELSVSRPMKASKTNLYTVGLGTLP